MALSGGEIDVIVARTTSGASWFGQPVDVLAGGAIVTRLTIHDLLGIGRVREIINALIVPNNDVRSSGLDTGQIGTGVNLVDHYLHVDGMARVGV